MDEQIQRDAARYKVLATGGVPELSVVDEEGLPVSWMRIDEFCDAAIAARAPGAPEAPAEADVQNLLRTLQAYPQGFGYKLQAWFDAPLLDADQLDRHHPVLAQLHVLAVQQAFGTSVLPGAGPCAAEFVVSTPAVFILDAGPGMRFLIDTQGHSYARYVGWLMRRPAVVTPT